jgi:predicted RNA-binding protein with PUA-like domain
MGAARGYWLVKSDPDTFGWDHLVRSPGRTTRWDGVRNYQARNSLRDAVHEGDGVLFYHSQTARAVVGTAKVVRAGYPDPTQFEASSPGFDPDSPPQAPRWYAVDIRAEEPFPSPVTLEAMRGVPRSGTSRCSGAGSACRSSPSPRGNGRRCSGWGSSPRAGRRAWPRK